MYLVDGEEYSFPREDECTPCCGGTSCTDILSSLGGDLESRDFTINALALPLPDYPDIPPASSIRDMAVGLPRSMSDLDARILRPAGATSLDDDPLRVFRAARMLSELPDFTAHPDLLAAMRRAASQDAIKTLPPERVGTELRKALRSPSPGRFIRILNETGALSPWFDELLGAGEIPAGPKPHHDESVLEHTAQLMDALSGNELACWMALTHDLGKTETPQDHHPSHHGHDRLGSPLAENLGKRLALPNRFISAGRLAAELHMTAARYRELRPGTRVDLLDSLHRTRLVEDMFRLVEADHGDDHMPVVADDLAAMLAVSLPEEFRNLGKESGERLRDMRAMTLAKLRGS